MTILDVIDLHVNENNRLSPELAMLYEIRDNLVMFHKGNIGSVKCKARKLIRRLDGEIERLVYNPLKYYRAYNQLMLAIQNNNNGKYKRRGDKR